jgi:PIN domain nuclease of toxin-antitoxin system
MLTRSSGAVDDPSKLSHKAVTALQDPGNDLLLSAGTIWEIAIKVGLGKLSLSMPYRDWMSQAITDLGITVLPITVEYADVQGNLPKHHGEPFDRLLVAQAQVESMVLVSADTGFDPYGIDRLW